jgi:hypothetical protein
MSKKTFRKLLLISSISLTVFSTNANAAADECSENALWKCKSGSVVNSGKSEIVGKYIGKIGNRHLIADPTVINKIDEKDFHRYWWHGMPRVFGKEWGPKKCLIGANSENDGSINQAKMIKQTSCKEEDGSVSVSEAAQHCAKFGDGWYLPAKAELDLMMKHRKEIDMAFNFYWSSTEFDKDEAWRINIYTGYWDHINYKGANHHVRCVKSALIEK